MTITDATASPTPAAGSIGALTHPDLKPSQAFGTLDKDAFMKLLVAQLRYQNPLSPVDGQQYLAQAAQMATVERLEQMAKAQTELVGYQQLVLSSGLIGREVKGTPVGGSDPIEGVVTSVRVKAGVPILSVNGRDVPIDSVSELHASPGAPKS